MFEGSRVQKEPRTIIAYVTVGADDIARAKKFYSAFLPALGYELEEGPEGLSYTLPVQPGQSPVLPDFYVKPPFDGRPATAGNGSMVAFQARNQKQVRDLHAAALIAGGSDEGPPGFRASYGPRFYVCYLRDPQGNKIALFSSNPDEPGRDG
ncbi:VOC family protein [Roseibium litorale]|uniref:VOC family protein n=1 Tax=Roseibium litorale TaxID=2803841 RepID=UPI0031B62B3E